MCASIYIRAHFNIIKDNADFCNQINVVFEKKSAFLFLAHRTVILLSRARSANATSRRRVSEYAHTPLVILSGVEESHLYDERKICMSSIFCLSVGKTIIAMKKIVKTSIRIGGGALVGFINGFFGGGGGMLCVPLLEKALGVPTKSSHATAILIILPISIASAVTYILGGCADWQATAIASIGVITGGAVGAVLLGKLRSGIVGIVFAVIMIVAGGKLLLP